MPSPASQIREREHPTRSPLPAAVCARFTGGDTAAWEFSGSRHGASLDCECGVYSGGSAWLAAIGSVALRVVVLHCRTGGNRQRARPLRHWREHSDNRRAATRHAAAFRGGSRVLSSTFPNVCFDGTCDGTRRFVLAVVAAGSTNALRHDVLSFRTALLSLHINRSCCACAQ